MSENPCKLVEFCVLRGLQNLSESLQYYWPATHAVVEGVQQSYLNPIAEANITVNIARVFSENNFLNWAEVPFAEGNRRLDFLAFNFSKDIVVYLEFKNNIWQPEKNLEDFWRLVDLYEKGVYTADNAFNSMDVNLAKHKIFGVISVLDAVEFSDWWRSPVDAKGNPLCPKNKSADTYRHIAKALSTTEILYTVPLKEYPWPDENPEEDARWRLRRAAYALYDEDSIQKLAKMRSEIQ